MKKMLVLIGLLCLSSTEALENTASIPSVYHRVAERFNIPVKILYAIALTESGESRTGAWLPWPWSLNVEGESYRFATQEEAKQTLRKMSTKGKHADIGLMQINSYWHGTRVEELSDLLNPHTNLEVGAEIIVEQYQRSPNDWWEVVGRYHSPAQDNDSKERAERYRQRVRKNYERIGERL